MRKTARRSRDLLALAQDYIDRQSVAGRVVRSSISECRDLLVLLDEQYCTEVAAFYDAAPRLAYDARLAGLYDQMKRENRWQYGLILDAGIEIEPWTGTGQPYRDSEELRRAVQCTGRLFVYLTRDGHGPPGDAAYHPMREPSGVSVRGIALTHNDVFRAVHDVFGHVMFDNGFGPEGEFRATFCQLHMYSDEVHPILFSEQIGQVCWFFFGPHLRDEEGVLPRHGDAAYLPPSRRPYAQQKVVAFDRRYIESFKSMFRRHAGQ